MHWKSGVLTTGSQGKSLSASCYVLNISKKTPKTYLLRAGCRKRASCHYLCLQRLKGRQGFSGGSAGKNLPANAGDTGSIPGSERSPGDGNGSLLQYSCLENSMDRGAWWAAVRGGTKSRTCLSVHTRACTNTHTKAGRGRRAFCWETGSLQSACWGVGLGWPT